jgi:hypothetical protein
MISSASGKYRIISKSQIQRISLFYTQWRPGRGGQGGHGPPLLLRPVGKLSMLSEIDGKLSMLSEIGKLSKLSTGGKGEDLKCCRPEKFLFVGKNFRFVGKVQSTALAPPPKKKPQKHRSHGATVYTCFIVITLVNQ